MTLRASPDPAGPGRGGGQARHAPGDGLGVLRGPGGFLGRRGGLGRLTGVRLPVGGQDVLGAGRGVGGDLGRELSARTVPRVVPQATDDGEDSQDGENDEDGVHGLIMPDTGGVCPGSSVPIDHPPPPPRERYLLLARTVLVRRENGTYCS